MKTNLKTIIKFRPCSRGITKLMNNLGHKCNRCNWEDVYNSLSKEQQTKDIDFKFILESNGVKDTFWCLYTQPKKIRMLISADVAESILHIYEEQYPNDMRVRNCIQGVRDYCDGKITQERLNVLKQDAADAAYDVYDIVVVDAAADVVKAAYDVADAAHTVAYAAYAAADAVNVAIGIVDVHIVAVAERWKKNEEILLKYC